jgi:hypothetical protein
MTAFALCMKCKGVYYFHYTGIVPPCPKCGEKNEN